MYPNWDVQISDRKWRLKLGQVVVPISDIYCSLEFRHSITLWFPNSLVYRHIFGQYMCLKTKIFVRVSDTSFCAMSEIQTLALGFQTAALYTFTVFNQITVLYVCETTRGVSLSYETNLTYFQ